MAYSWSVINNNCCKTWTGSQIVSSLLLYSTLYIYRMFLSISVPSALFSPVGLGLITCSYPAALSGLFAVARINQYQRLPGLKLWNIFWPVNEDKSCWSSLLWVFKCGSSLWIRSLHPLKSSCFNIQGYFRQQCSWDTAGTLKFMFSQSTNMSLKGNSTNFSSSKHVYGYCGASCGFRGSCL